MFLIEKEIEIQMNVLTKQYLYNNEYSFVVKRLSIRFLSLILCGDLEDWDGRGWVGGGDTQERGDICIHIADSLQCTAETNTVL